MIKEWLRGLRHSYRATVAGNSDGLRLDHKLAIDLGHVVLGPLLAAYGAPEAAAAWALIYGVGKQTLDAIRGERIWGAIGDSLSMTLPTAMALYGVAPEWVGAVMAATMLAYAAERGRRAAA